MKIVLLTTDENEYPTKELDFDSPDEEGQILDKMTVHNMIGEMIMETGNIKALRIEEDGKVLRTAHVTIHETY